ncbi:hypothetical protein [Streptomyces sp. NPDC088794]|uniref:hypothetical protein n=1 Tax=Streptomyces sp. NPDC088794 TaxID=3365902 RepID=UPI00382D4D10
MTGTVITHTRTAIAASLSIVLAVLLSGCTGDAKAYAPPPGSTGVDSALGRLTVHIADIDLTITDAVAHLDRSGDGTLTMSVRNDGAVPEHLGMVATPDEGRGVLVGAKSAKGNGSLSTAGILVLSGTTVTFRGAGPAVELHDVRGVTARHTLPVTLQFGVAGLLHLRTPVSSS